MLDLEKASVDGGELEAHQLCDLANPRQLVPAAESDVVRRPLGAPGLHELGGAPGEADARIRVADRERRTRNRLALRCEELQPAGRGLRQAEGRDPTQAPLHLDRQARTGPPAVEL